MVFGNGYLKNFGSVVDDPKAAVTWESHYQELKQIGDIEEAARKGHRGRMVYQAAVADRDAAEDVMANEDDNLRTLQSRKVSLLIGGLLDAWENVPNDLRSEIEEVCPMLYSYLNRISKIMEE